MNKAVVFGLASVVCGMLSAGEKVSVGLAGDVSLERGQVEISPRLYEKSWGACRSKGGWKPGADGSYAFPASFTELLEGSRTASVTLTQVGLDLTVKGEISMEMGGWIWWVDDDCRAKVGNQ